MMKYETDVLKHCSTIRDTYYRDILLALKDHHSELSLSLQERFKQLDESLITFLEGSGIPNIQVDYVEIMEDDEASRLKLEEEFTKKRIKKVRYLRNPEGALTGPPNKRHKLEGNDNHDLTLSQVLNTCSFFQRTETTGERPRNNNTNDKKNETPTLQAAPPPKPPPAATSQKTS